MKRKGAALVQQGDTWYAVDFAIRERRIADLSVHTGKDLPELKAMLQEDGYAVALEDVSGYLFNLTFPFSDSRKIRLVIGNELEERMPLSAEDMSVDFIPGGNGTVLAAAVQNSILQQFQEDKHVKATTLRSLAALHALRWFNAIPDRDYVFLHMSGPAVVVMGYKDGALHSLRHFFHSPHAGTLVEVFKDVMDDPSFRPRSFLMISDNEDAGACKEELEKACGIQLQMPRLASLLNVVEAPEWLWPGIGAGLISIHPKGQINLSGARHSSLFLSSKATFRLSAAIAALSLIVSGLFYLDYALKERTYQYLSAQPNLLYKQAFPKSPPVKDPVAMFREKIRALEPEPGAISAGAGPLTVFNEISAKIPAEIDVKVQEFTADEKEFLVSGTTVSFASVEKIKAAVEQMKGVSQVEVQNLELAPGKQVKFKVRGKL